MHALLASFGDTATNPFALAFLAAGLFGSVAIGAGPSLRQFARELPSRLASTRQEALEVAKDPGRAAASAGAIAQWPRPAMLYGLLGLALTAWVAYAFTQPATEMQPVQLEHVSSFGYIARGAPSVALPDGAVGPVSTETVAETGGQPTLYSAALSNIDFGYDYEMRAPQRLEVLATGAAALRIRAQDGWERTIMLQPNEPLAGSRSTMLFTVNLDAVRLVIAGVERTTGAKSDWYDLRVVPVVRLAGQMGAAHIDETYARELNLRYDRVRITPEAAPLSRTERKPGNTLVEVTHRAHLFGLSMELGTARWAAALGAIVALVGAALLVAARPKPGAAAASAAPAAPESRPVAPPVPVQTSAPAVDPTAGPAAVPPDPVPPASAPSATSASASNLPVTPPPAEAAPAAVPPASAASAATANASNPPVTPSPADTPVPPAAPSLPMPADDATAPPAAEPAAPPDTRPPYVVPRTSEYAHPAGHTPADDLLGASVATCMNGASHADLPPLDDAERTSRRESPAA